jgi:hypothetical protein
MAGVGSIAQKKRERVGDYPSEAGKFFCPWRNVSFNLYKVNIHKKYDIEKSEVLKFC